MLKKLRIKIVLINMSIIGIVLTVILVLACFWIYNSEKAEVDAILNNAITEFDTVFSEKTEIGKQEQKEKNKKNKKNNDDDDDDSATSPGSFDGNAVAVVTDSFGTILNKREYNSTIDTSILEECVEIALSGEKSEGKIRISGEDSNYRLRFLVQKSTENCYIAFTDYENITSSMKKVGIIGLIAFIVVMLCILVINLVWSGIVLQPVEKAWTSQRQFISDASHELKTPLTVILANMNILESHTGGLSSDQCQWIESTKDEANRMKSLIEQMLYLAKSDEDALMLNLSSINVSELAESSALVFDPVAFEKNVTVETLIQPSVMLETDRALFEKLIYIFLDNAVKHAVPGSIINMTLARENGHVHISVTNFGDTISPEDLPHIFDRFYKADKSRTADEASDSHSFGLGLAIASSIVEKLGGKITVTSDAEKGTCFKLVF